MFQFKSPSPSKVKNFIFNRSLNIAIEDDSSFVNNDYVQWTSKFSSNILLVFIHWDCNQACQDAIPGQIKDRCGKDAGLCNRFPSTGNSCGAKWKDVDAIGDKCKGKITKSVRTKIVKETCRKTCKECGRCFMFNW